MEAERAVRRIQTGMVGFAEDMRRQDIHVGLGLPPVCVCGEPWPCPKSRQDDGGEHGN